MCTHARTHTPSLESWYSSDADDPGWADSNAGLNHGLILDIQQTNLEAEHRISSVWLSNKHLTPLGLCRNKDSILFSRWDDSHK